MQYSDIEKFPHCSYRVDVAWSYIEWHIGREESDVGLDLNPDFQRAHVWDSDQQSKYCEYILMGGTSGKELYFNCPGWNSARIGSPYVIVDGKQRLEAVRRFLRNEIPVFGQYKKDFNGEPDMLVARFSWNIAAIETRAEVLRWYLNFNSGGVVHSQDELDKVRRLLAAEANQ